MYLRGPRRRWRFLAPALLALVLAAAVLSVGDMGDRADGESLRLAEQTLRRAAVECYALEGTYPQNVQHLYDVYGVAVDRERYVVHYEYVASNLVPDITVLPARP